MSSSIVASYTIRNEEYASYAVVELTRIKLPKYLYIQKEMITFVTEIQQFNNNSMDRLDEYIAKYGRHFTVELALKVTNSRWSASEIEKTSETIVYYNVSEATLGDIIYLANIHYKNNLPFHLSKRRCIRYALGIIGDVNTNGYAFNLWTQNML